jgi:microcompartment protein CcmK/EutM
MTLGRVVGTVVSTRKDERLEGFKLLIVKAVDPSGEDKRSYLVAVDTVDAGMGELVLVVAGSSARMSSGCQERPVDAAIVGIVDAVDVDALVSGSRDKR